MTRNDGTSSNRESDEVMFKLRHAVQANQVEEVKRLIAAGAPVSTYDAQSHTSLHMVRSKEVAHLLIAAGANVNALSSGATPLHWVHDAGIAHALLAAGADVNARDTWGKTPLHIAAAHASDTSAAIVRCLLDAPGVEVDARAKNGRTPLWEAAEAAENDWWEYEEVTMMLVAAGANLDDCWIPGETVRKWLRDFVSDELCDKLERQANSWKMAHAIESALGGPTQDGEASKPPERGPSIL